MSYAGLGSNLDLVVPTVAVQSHEERGIPQAVNAIVHSRDWVRILDRERV